MADVGPSSLAGLISVLTQLVQGQQQLIVEISKVFPQTTSTATSATGGSETLPSQPVGFLVVLNPVTGGTVKIPYYSE